MKEYFRSNLKTNKDIIIPILIGIVMIFTSLILSIYTFISFIQEVKLSYLFGSIFFLFLIPVAYIVPRQIIQDNIIIDETNITIIRPKIIKYWQKKNIEIPLKSVRYFYPTENSIFLLSNKDNLATFTIPEKNHRYNDINEIKKVLLKLGKKESEYPFIK